MRENPQKTFDTFKFCAFYQDVNQTVLLVTSWRTYKMFYAPDEVFNI